MAAVNSSSSSSGEAERVGAGAAAEFCESMVQSIVYKFLGISEEEATEWDLYPEGRYLTDKAERELYALLAAMEGFVRLGPG